MQNAESSTTPTTWASSTDVNNDLAEANVTAFTAVMRYNSSNWQTSFLNVEDLLNRVQLRLVCQPFLL
jgi:hypothetical protein